MLDDIIRLLLLHHMAWCWCDSDLGWDTIMFLITYCMWTDFLISVVFESWPTIFVLHQTHYIKSF